MSSITIALLAILVLFVAIFLGSHIGFSLALISFLGMWAVTGSPQIALQLLGTTVFEALRDYIFAVVPLFILMGAFMSNSRAAEYLYAAVQLLLRNVLGGLAIATVVANAIFAAVTGVSVASAAVFSKVALPEMERHGYQQRFALGSIAGSSVLGMLIPPSLLMILYGILTQVSIGRLFLGGVLPGLLLATLYSIGIILMVKFKPDLIAPDANSANSESQETSVQDSGNSTKPSNLKVLLGAVPLTILVALVIGGIWGGIFTPTEASAIGASGALILGVFLGLRKKNLLNSFLETAQTTGSIMFLLIAAQMYSRMLASTGFIGWLSSSITATLSAPLVITVVYIVIVVLLGTVLDSASIILLTVPVIFPVITAVGADPLWFGIVTIVAVEVGIITPPFGMIPFTMSAVLGDRVNAEDIFIGAFPFVIIMLVFLAVLVAFPSLSTWLPNLFL